MPATTERKPRFSREENRAATIKMIQRCAKHQPENPSYGTAARNGEHTVAYTSWGVGQFNTDMSRTFGVPDVLYPAIKLLDDGYDESRLEARPHVQHYFTAPAAPITASEVQQRNVRVDPAWFDNFSPPDWRRLWDSMRAQMAQEQRRHERTFGFTVSADELRYMRLDWTDIVRLHANRLPAETRPPENAVFTVESVYEHPESRVVSVRCYWSEP
jgi:hypothetical protein